MMRRRVLIMLAFAWTCLPAGQLLAADPPAELPFKVLASGRAPGQQAAGSSTARDEKSYRQIWSDLKLEGHPPKVNFTRRMVIAWVGGGAACDGFRLVHAREGATDLDLEIEHSHPKLHQMCIAIYAPSHIVATIPRTSKPVKFTITEIPRT